MHKFLSFVLVLPFSTADCERAFSKMNGIKTAKRNRLGDIIRALMIINCARPENFDSLNYDDMSKAVAHRTWRGKNSKFWVSERLFTIQICISRARAIFPSAGYLTEMVPTAGFAGSFFNSLPLESSAKVTNMLQTPRTPILFLLRHSDESHQMSDSSLIKFPFSIRRCKTSARIFFS